VRSLSLDIDLGHDASLVRDPAWVSVQTRIDDGATPAEDLPDLLARAAGRAAAAGATAITFEAEPAPESLDRLCRSAGYELARTTLQLRCPLPVPADRRPSPRADGSPPPELDLRSFRPGLDDDAWLDVNRRAFSWHPEQGRWSGDDLRDRQLEEWFRADGFLVHDAPGKPGRIDGFCWTKIHADHEPPLGEIYVIGVDPDDHGHGMGRALVLAGLDWLSDAGLQIGMLYVESDNEPALKLYRDLGFTEHLAHRWWRRDL